MILQMIFAALIAYCLFLLGYYFLSDWKDWCRRHYIKTNLWTFLKITFTNVKDKDVYEKEEEEEE